MLHIVRKIVLAIIFLWVVCIYTAPYLPFENIFLEGLIQYRPHLLVVCLGLSLILLFVTRAYLVLPFVCLLCLLGIWQSATPYVAQAGEACEAANASELRVMTYNVYHQNKEYADILGNIQSVDPDIFILQEMKSGFYRYAHKRLAKRYPFHFIELEQGTPQGIAFYSKYPIERAQMKKLTRINYILEAQINMKGRLIDVVGVHAPSPRTAQRIADRNDLIKTLAVYLQGREDLIVMGDFNSAPWQSDMRAFQEALSVKTIDLSYVLQGVRKKF